MHLVLLEIIIIIMVSAISSVTITINSAHRGPRGGPARINCVSSLSVEDPFNIVNGQPESSLDVGLRRRPDPPVAVKATYPGTRCPGKCFVVLLRARRSLGRHNPRNR